MTPAEFLAVVLPSSGSGQYCAVELTNRKEHFYAETIDDLIPKIDAWHAAKCDVFFAVATFDTKRGTENAQFVRSFFIDMDGYASKKAAATALDNFLAKWAKNDDRLQRLPVYKQKLYHGQLQVVCSMEHTPLQHKLVRVLMGK